MLKKWFTLPTVEEPEPPAVPPQNGSTNRPSKAETEEATAPGRLPAATASGAAMVPKYGPFEQVYQAAAVKPPRLPYGILKVAEMMNSGHLSGMSAEAKRCSLLMALEAAGAEVEDLLQDAVVRQRALNDYEDSQKNRLKNFEQAKADDNNKIQAELDRITTQYMGRIQANLDEVAKEQDAFRAWQRAKQVESQRITDAAAYCVPQTNSGGVPTLSAVLERASAVHR
jgi:hypothetical protein